MQIPFIKYIEAMFTCKLSVDTIKECIQKTNVTLSDKFDNDLLLKIYNTLSATNEDYFKTPDAIPDPTWLRELEIEKYVAWYKKLEIPEGTFGIKGMFEILNDPNMYPVITALALAKINEEDIELIVNGKYNIHYSSDDMKEFLHYVFNVQDWTLTDKKQYIGQVTSSELKTLYDLALEGDKDYLIWKLGIAPDKSFDQMLRDMMSDSYYNFKEKLQISDADSAQKWGNLALRITDRVERFEKETSERKNIFDEIQFVLTGKKSDEQLQITTRVGKKFKHFTDIKEGDRDGE